MHKVRRPRQLAVIRSVWWRRDEIARRRDTSPGRVLPDSAIVAAATATAGSTGAAASEALAALPAFAGRGARRHLRDWQEAVTSALDLPESELPTAALPPDGPPPPRSWPDRDPDAAARLSAARAGLAVVAERRIIPVENLVSPDLVRRLCWTPPAELDESTVTAALRAGGARAWQTELVLPVLLDALARSAGEVARATAARIVSPEDDVLR
jgi:ribonuclease D